MSFSNVPATWKKEAMKVSEAKKRTTDQTGTESPDPFIHTSKFITEL